MVEHHDIELNIHAGIVIRDEEIEAFMTTLGDKRPRHGDPFNDLDDWLRKKRLIGRIGSISTRVKMPGMSDNPTITVIDFGMKIVRLDQVDIDETGVVPKIFPPASDEVKQRARGWLGLDPSDDYDVSALADRFAYINCQTDDDSARLVFAAMAKVTGKAPKDLQFALVYEEGSMAIYKWLAYNGQIPKKYAWEEKKANKEGGDNEEGGANGEGETNGEGEANQAPGSVDDAQGDFVVPPRKITTRLQG